MLLLMGGLAERGHECTLLAAEEGPLYKAARRAGHGVDAATMIQIWRHAREAWTVHAHDARGHTLAAIASRRPFVVSRRVAFPVRRTAASRWKYRRAARFLAVSQFVAGQLRTAGVRADKIDVVYDGVEAPETEAQWDSAHPAIGLASSDPQKGRDLLERAAQISGIPVVYSNDMRKDLLRASMFVYVSRSEGFGSAALLAMSMGVPVIASKAGGLIEAVDDGNSGLLVENDPREIAMAMRRIVEEHDLAAKLIDCARARVKETFTKEHLISRTLASYERALAP